MAGFEKMLSRYLFVFYGSFCPINMDFYDRYSSVDLKASINLGTHDFSHLQTTTQKFLSWPKEIFEKWIIVILIGMSSCRSRGKTLLSRNTKAD